MISKFPRNDYALLLLVFVQSAAWIQSCFLVIKSTSNEQPSAVVACTVSSQQLVQNTPEVTPNHCILIKWRQDHDMVRHTDTVILTVWVSCMYRHVWTEKSVQQRKKISLMMFPSLSSLALVMSSLWLAPLTYKAGTLVHTLLLGIGVNSAPQITWILWVQMQSPVSNWFLIGQ